MSVNMRAIVAIKSVWCCFLRLNCRVRRAASSSPARALSRPWESVGAPMRRDFVPDAWRSRRSRCLTFPANGSRSPVKSPCQPRHCSGGSRAARAGRLDRATKLLWLAAQKPGFNPAGSPRPTCPSCSARRAAACLWAKPTIAKPLAAPHHHSPATFPRDALPAPKPGARAGGWFWLFGADHHHRQRLRLGCQRHRPRLGIGARRVIATACWPAVTMRSASWSSPASIPCKRSRPRNAVPSTPSATASRSAKARRC